MLFFLLSLLARGQLLRQLKDVQRPIQNEQLQHLLQDGLAAAGRGAAQRLADWWLSQLRWMVPQAEQPVRAVRLAALVVQLARLLPSSAPGTRVVPPELLSAASIAPDAEPVFAAWLAGTWKPGWSPEPPQR